MYTNSVYCDNLDYVQSNLLKGQVIEYIELNSNNLPEPIYEDDPKRYWEIWKVVRGYKLYSMSNFVGYEPKILGDEVINEGFVRLYRTVPKPVVKKELSVGPDLADKPTVPCDPVIPVGAG